MRILTSSLSLLVLCMAASTSTADFVVLDQIGVQGAAFSTTTYNGGTLGLSTYDTNAATAAPDYQRADFLRTYDNFTSGVAGITKNFSWVGGREDLAFPDPGNNFRISIYADAAGAPTPYTSDGGVPAQFNNTPLQTFTVAATSSNFTNDYKLYSADASFNFAAGTQYWVSIMNEQNYDTFAGWGLAYSGIGDVLSVQDDGEDLLTQPTRFTDGVDFSMKITAVPEPSSAMLGLVGLGLIGFRRRRA